MLPWFLCLTRIPSSTGFLGFDSDCGLLMFFEIIDATSVLSVSSVVSPEGALFNRVYRIRRRRGVPSFPRNRLYFATPAGAGLCLDFRREQLAPRL